MRRGRAVWAVTLAGLTAAVMGGPARADDEKKPAPQPAPQADGKAAVPAGFRAFVVVDDRFPPKEPAKPAPGAAKDPKDKPADGKPTPDPRTRTDRMHDLVTEQGLNPVLAVFTREQPSDASAAGKLLKLLPPVVLKHKGDNLGAFVAFLNKAEAEYPADDRKDDKGNYLREAEAKAVADLAAQLKGGGAKDPATGYTALRVPLVTAAGTSPQVAAWGVAADDDTVAVLYDRMRVLQRWAFKAGQPPTDAQLAEIAAAADKAASGK